MDAAVPISPEAIIRRMRVTPPRYADETRDDLTQAPRKNHGESPSKIPRQGEDLVEQDFSVSGNCVGRFVFDKELRIVKLYNFENRYDSDHPPKRPRLLMTHRDWIYFYNQIWTYFAHDGNIWYRYEWDGETPGVRYKAIKRPDSSISVSSCLNKTLHDQDYFKMVNKKREDSARDYSDYSDQASDSDGNDKDWPSTANFFLFPCCKKGLYYEPRDIPMLKNIFSTIDDLFYMNRI